MSWLSRWLGQDTPKPPDLRGSASELYDMSDQVMEMFTPETRDQLLGSTRASGTRQIGQATSAANRAVGSSFGASGLYGSGAQAEALQGNYAGASDSLVGLEAELARLGLNFDSQQMQSIMAGASLRGQGDSLIQQNYANQMAYNDASDPFGTLLNLGLSAGAIAALGFGGVGGIGGGGAGVGGFV